MTSYQNHRLFHIHINGSAQRRWRWEMYEWAPELIWFVEGVGNFQVSLDGTGPAVGEQNEGFEHAVSCELHFDISYGII